MRALGVSGGFGHDAAAAIVVDGTVVVMAEEERLSRRKDAVGEIPVNAIHACLKYAGLSVADIDALCLSWNPAKDPSNHQMQSIATRISSESRLEGLEQRTRVYDHHACHAAAAFLYADVSAPAMCIVADGRGELTSTSVYRVWNGGTELIESSPLVASLGTFYAAATEFCGFRRGGQGKTMGLAAYGEAVDAFPELSVDDLRVDAGRANLMREHDDPTHAHRQMRQDWLDAMVERFGPQRRAQHLTDEFLCGRPDSTFERHHADLAASVQLALERVIVELARNTMHRFPGVQLVFAGGVALNCSLNGRLRSTFPDARLHFNPVPHDAGSALGAAVLATWESGGAVTGISTPYLGIGWSHDQLTTLLNYYGVAAERPTDLSETVADYLADGRTVAWFQGRSEVGPRALGHRSILGRPDLDSMKATMNNKIKRREAWRPLGPSVLDSEMIRLFPRSDTPYMIEAQRMHPALRAEFSSVAHVDGTSRPQSVTDWSDTEQLYPRLLAALRERTGWGLVLNTSFNDFAEPIVHSPIDALRTFFSTPLEALALGPYLLRKSEK
ncbi:carbamoyltransferase [Catenulispora sp. GAS73]|uniref:carbamoyltransferase family protein n=1 Tax=Catenulispora sp. GAS73 TaxID=3156269 RepID=UPI003519092A